MVPNNWYAIARVKKNTFSARKNPEVNQGAYAYKSGLGQIQWAMVVAGEYSVPEGFEISVQKLSTLLYAGDEFLASPQPARIQEALDVLTCLLNRVGLQTNVENTVVMVC